MTGFDARCVPHLRAAEDRHFWFRARNAALAAVLRQLDPALPGGYRALEIGCGTGNTLQVMAAECRGGRVFGFDADLGSLDHARDRVGPRVMQADIAWTPFAASMRFQLIGMFDVLEHIADESGALSRVRELLTGDGVFLVTVPASKRLWSAFDVASHHQRRYEPDELGQRLVQAGFTVEYLTPFMAAVYPLAWIKRRLAASLRASDPFDAAVDDLRVVPVANSILGWLLSPEAGAIARRRRLPFGTSVLAIARRSR
jgi:SAM-dependent methyltransferase